MEHREAKVAVEVPCKRRGGERERKGRGKRREEEEREMRRHEREVLSTQYSVLVSVVYSFCRST